MKKGVHGAHENGLGCLKVPWPSSLAVAQELAVRARCALHTRIHMTVFALEGAATRRVRERVGSGKPWADRQARAGTAQASTDSHSAPLGSVASGTPRAAGRIESSAAPRSGIPPSGIPPVIADQGPVVLRLGTVRQ